MPLNFLCLISLILHFRTTLLSHLMLMYNLGLKNDNFSFYILILNILLAWYRLNYNYMSLFISHYWLSSLTGKLTINFNQAIPSLRWNRREYYKDRMHLCPFLMIKYIGETTIYKLFLLLLLSILLVLYMANQWLA